MNEKMKNIFLVLVITFSIVNVSTGQIKIGLALPLMKNSEDAEEKKTGMQILKGVNDALREYNESDESVTVLTVSEDTKKDAAITLEILNRFGTDSNFIAVFGPVYSSEIINNAGAPLFHKIPVITPTATVNFLAVKNPYLFQLNPTYDVRGRLMAKFAMNELGMKNFVILSEDNYGKNIAGSFSEEIISNKGTIEAAEYYSKDSIDIKSQIENLKKKIAGKDKFIDFGKLTANQIEKLKNAKLKFSNTDSLINAGLTVSIYKLFGKNAERISDSLKLFPVTLPDISQKVIPGYIDAIYIPVSSYNDIGKISLEYFSSGINLPVIGTSDWSNEKALSDNKSYIKELYFDSDFYLKDNSKGDSFGNNETEIRNYYFGYDGMKLILNKISEGNKTRKSLNEALENTVNYEAEHINYSISERTNHEMSVMYLKNGELKKLMNYKY